MYILSQLDSWEGHADFLFYAMREAQLQLNLWPGPTHPPYSDRTKYPAEKTKPRAAKVRCARPSIVPKIRARLPVEKGGRVLARADRFREPNRQLAEKASRWILATSLPLRLQSTLILIVSRFFSHSDNLVNSIESNGKACAKFFAQIRLNPVKGNYSQSTFSNHLVLLR